MCQYRLSVASYFAESAGKLADYWQLPTQFTMKDMDSIPSNKRSMYRKRYAMLEDLQQRMLSIFQPEK